jgi:hypothetical protein
VDINQQFPSKYLKADTDIPDDGDLIVTIDTVQIETIGQGADQENKPVVYFRETDKGLVLNKTNAQTIKGLFGFETDDWEGKRIALFGTEVDFAGKQTLAIRVRMKAPASRNRPLATETAKEPVAVGATEERDPFAND